MRLDFDDDQLDLVAAVGAVLARECTPRLVRAVFEGEASWAPLYGTMSSLGWQSLAVPERRGGLGLGFVEVGIVVEALGRHVAPGPYVTTTTQLLPALLALDEARTEELVAGVLAGVVTGTLVDGDVTATVGDGGGLRLDGEVAHVLGAGDVTHLAVVADASTTLAVVAAGAAGIRIEAEEALDPSRALGRVILDGVDIDPPWATDCAASVARIREEAACGLALEALGTAQAAFDMTLDHARDRVQFDRPIGSFQAIKHKLADMYVALARARALCTYAALTIAADDPRRALAVSMAKAGVGDCQRLVAKESLQIHGGVGYTWEHPLHLHLRRLKTDDALCGTAAEHRGRVADILGL